MEKGKVLACNVGVGGAVDVAIKWLPQPHIIPAHVPGVTRQFEPELKCSSHVDVWGGWA